MPRLPPSAHVSIDDDGALVATDFADTYFSRDGGLAETRAVFLAGCNLPARWLGRPSFTIGELGFGSGLNFLAVWEAWRATRTPKAILHFVSIEGFLLDASVAAAVHGAAAPELASLSQQLIDRWPVRTRGVQRTWFEEDGICLTIGVGDAKSILTQMDLAADAWFLDGFAPARNPAMWSPGVLTEVSRLSAPDALAATYSVAGPVRRGLEAAGFQVSKEPGFGRKRQRLAASLPGPSAKSASRPSSAMVIGGGIGGAAMAQALHRRGLDVCVVDADPGGATKASANPRALAMPRLDRAETPEARFHRAAFVLAVQELRRLGAPAATPSGVVELPRSARDQERARDLLSDPPLPEAWLCDGGQGQLHHRTGLTLVPRTVVASLLEGAAQRTDPVVSIQRPGTSWQALGTQGQVIAEAELCILAAGPGTQALLDDAISSLQPTKAKPLDLALAGRHGVLSYAPLLDGAKPPPVPLAGGAYAGAYQDLLFFGATFDAWPLDRPPQPPQGPDHARNQALLSGQVPELARSLAIEQADGRASVRTTTADRIPIAGCVEGLPGLAVLTGLGARGFTTAFLAAEVITAQLLGEPFPTERDVTQALSLHRFARRAARKGTTQSR